MTVIETRQKLLEVALDLIWQSSYNNVGVNEICSTAGVTKGAFYHHFDSKATLFYEATTYYWEVIKHDLDSIFSPLNTPMQQLENLIHFLFVAKFGEDSTNAPGCPFYNAGAQIGTKDEKVIAALRCMADMAAKYNTMLVTGLSSQGYLERQDDPELLARLIYQYIHGVMSYAHVSTDIELAKYDLPSGLYRLLSVKPEFWFSVKPTWSPKSSTNT
jgi:TetR/AcrR family transcriptional repressor of nem operon